MSDGSPISVKPGQIRFWLNTLAFRGHLNQVVLARWMGRNNVAANARYDGRPAAELIRELRGGMTLAGLLEPDEEHAVAPVTREHPFFEDDETGYVTPAGVCASEYDARPCPFFLKSLEHADFDEFVEAMPEDAAGVFLRRIEKLGAAAEVAAVRKVPGAEDWALLYRDLCERFAWLHCFNVGQNAEEAADILETT